MAEPVPMPEDWSDRAAVEAWLRTQPREVCVALAARAALRVLPLVVAALDPDGLKERRAIMLPVFRATAAPWLAAFGPSQGAEEKVRAAAAAASVAIAAANSDAAFPIAVTDAPIDEAHHAAFVIAANAVTATIQDTRATVVVTSTITFAAGHGAVANAATATDAAAFAAGHGAVAHAALWPEGVPAWAEAAWSTLRDHLLAANEGWEVWTGWYEARLNGDPVDVALETRRVIEPTRWDEGPAAVNAEIAAILADHEAQKQGAHETPETPPVLPEPKLAPVSFAFRDGRIHREPPPPPDPPEDQAPALRSAWTALHQSLTDLIEDDAGRELQLGRALRRCLAALGDDAGSVDVILLGEHARTLSAIAQRADEILLPEIAAQVVSLDARLSIYLAWFPSWAAYAKAMAEPMADPVAEQAAVDQAKAAVATINDAAPDLIASDAQEPLDALAEAATPVPSPDDPAPVAPAQPRRGYLRSARDLLLKLCGGAIDDVGTGVRKGVQKYAETQTVAALGAATAYLVALATAIPGEFQFLLPVIAYLKLLTNRS